MEPRSPALAGRFFTLSHQGSPDIFSTQIPCGSWRRSKALAGPRCHACGKGSSGHGVRSLQEGVRCCPKCETQRSVCLAPALPPNRVILTELLLHSALLSHPGDDVTLSTCSSPLVTVARRGCGDQVVGPSSWLTWGVTRVLRLSVGVG